MAEAPENGIVTPAATSEQGEVSAGASNGTDIQMREAPEGGKEHSAEHREDLRVRDSRSASPEAYHRRRSISPRRRYDNRYDDRDDDRNENPGTNIYVNKLPSKVDSAALAALFEPYGTVLKANIVCDPREGYSRGFGFVEMTDSNNAAEAIKNLNGFNHDGRELVVELARRAEPRRPTPGSFCGSFRPEDSGHRKRISGHYRYGLEPRRGRRDLQDDYRGDFRDDPRDDRDNGYRSYRDRDYRDYRDTRGYCDHNHHDRGYGGGSYSGSGSRYSSYGSGAGFGRRHVTSGHIDY
ncbi:RNA-binding domain-containing protein [Aulographum hederae CBS 113979]|uniref:RNA-binding domain-containing protein n=1 Tax=Aulographum hederae CBS 113979 TaxID=1176131 RepID=A0A6G1HF00_9PEZI|nr:RNA-binding domain-containing protein [Aulographum hederae CBS 113979]